MTNIYEIAKLYESSLANELSLARFTFNHSGQKGSSLERVVQSLLTRFLPDNVAVTEGIVIDSEGFVSQQLDIILYDKSRAQLFYNSDSTKVVPAEFVFAIGEVKAKLDKKGYVNFFQSQLKVKNSIRNFIISPESECKYSYNGYGKTWFRPPIASFLISFDANEKTTYGWAKQSHQNDAINNCIDAIICLEKFSIHRMSEYYGPDLLQGRMVSLDCVQHCAQQSPLFIFLGMLAKAASEWRMRESAVMAKYFMQGTWKAKLSEPLKPDIVAHDYLKPIPEHRSTAPLPPPLPPSLD